MEQLLLTGFWKCISQNTWNFMKLTFQLRSWFRSLGWFRFSESLPLKPLEKMSWANKQKRQLIAWVFSSVTVVKVWHIYSLLDKIYSVWDARASLKKWFIVATHSIHLHILHLYNYFGIVIIFNPKLLMRQIRATSTHFVIFCHI